MKIRLLDESGAMYTAIVDRETPEDELDLLIKQTEKDVFQYPKYKPQLEDALKKLKKFCKNS